MPVSHSVLEAQFLLGEPVAQGHHKAKEVQLSRVSEAPLLSRPPNLQPVPVSGGLRRSEQQQMCRSLAHPSVDQPHLGQWQALAEECLPLRHQPQARPPAPSALASVPSRGPSKKLTSTKQIVLQSKSTLTKKIETSDSDLRWKTVSKDSLFLTRLSCSALHYRRSRGK